MNALRFHSRFVCGVPVRHTNLMQRSKVRVNSFDEADKAIMQVMVMEEVDRAVTALYDNCDRLEGKVDTVTQNVQEVKSSVKEVKYSMQDLERSVKDLKSSLKDLERPVQDLKSSLKDLERSGSTSRDKVDDLSFWVKIQLVVVVAVYMWVGVLSILISQEFSLWEARSWCFWR